MKTTLFSRYGIYLTVCFTWGTVCASFLDDNQTIDQQEDSLEKSSAEKTAPSVDAQKQEMQNQRADPLEFIDQSTDSPVISKLVTQARKRLGSGRIPQKIDTRLEGTVSLAELYEILFKLEEDLAARLDTLENAEQDAIARVLYERLATVKQHIKALQSFNSSDVNLYLSKNRPYRGPSALFIMSCGVFLFAGAGALVLASRDSSGGWKRPSLERLKANVTRINTKIAENETVRKLSLVLQNTPQNTQSQSDNTPINIGINTELTIEKDDDDNQEDAIGNQNNQDLPKIEIQGNENQTPKTFKNLPGRVLTGIGNYLETWAN